MIATSLRAVLGFTAFVLVSALALIVSPLLLVTLAMLAAFPQKSEPHKRSATLAAPARFPAPAVRRTKVVAR